MNFRRLAHLGISILLLLGVVNTYIPHSVVSSMNAPLQGGPPPPPPPERIVPGGQGFEKLAPDLQQLLESTPLFDQSLAYNVETKEPLIVSAMIQPGADVERFFTRSAHSRQVSGFEWVSGEIEVFQLRKLAGVSEVVGVISNNSFQTAEAPGLDALRGNQRRIDPKQMRALLAQGGPEKLLELAKIEKTEALTGQQNNLGALQIPQAAAATVKDLLDVHDVKRVRDAGYKGDGVMVGVVDTGVDFSHPDLIGTQATINNNGPYGGWPFAYDTISGLLYTLDEKNTLDPENYWDQVGTTGFVHTLPVENAACESSTCSAELVLVGDAETGVSARFTWPDTSLSHQYYYSVHPDYYLAVQAYYLGINYPEGWLLPPAVIVSDEVEAGVYDAVYVDVNFNHRLTDENERMSRSNPMAGADLGQGTAADGIWDLSAGLLAWISDGLHHPPGVSVLYPDILERQVPDNGRLLVFIMDPDGHGTNCASVIAGQNQVTDPKGLGPSNPLYAGGIEIGGVGGGVIASVARDVKIAAFQNGFSLPFDSWTLAVFGMDGDPTTGDGVNIVSNSWGDSRVIQDGWDPVSRFAQNLSYTEASSVSILAATGNGGHGYGTRTSPGGGSILDVGASTAYGSMKGFDFVNADQFLYGDIQPWSNRGPGMLGDFAPDIVAVGAWGAAATPLNYSWGDGQRAYSIFGGTSMSTPVVAGGLALVYQAFWERNGRWPTWKEARNILLGSAMDLGYDSFGQGSGNLQVGRAVDMALKKAPSLYPSQWQAGSYQGVKYPAFPAVLQPGRQDAKTFTVNNPRSTSVAVTLDDSILQSYHEETFSFSYATTETSEASNLPIFLKDISNWIDQENPDLVRAQVVMPYANFDVENDMYPDNWWNLYLYDWTDHNGDNNLWTDDNHNGRVEKQEIDIELSSGLAEFNRFSFAYPQSDYLEATVGRSALSRRHKGVYLGLGCNFCGDSTMLQVRVTFYRKVDWNWLRLSTTSMTVPGSGGEGKFVATLTVPSDALPGAYEGVIGLNIGGDKSIIPVSVQVAANTSTFRFGAPGNLGTPYDNAHMFGGFNWNWRYEAGDWRVYYADFPPGSAASGKTVVVDTIWGSPTTDIDTWLLGPAQGGFALEYPQIFGPNDLALSSGSNDRYAREGKFAWETSTGTSREIIAGPVRDGLNVIALHNVLNDGLQLAEQFRGMVYQIAIDPGEVVLPAVVDNMDPLYLSGTQNVTFTATADISEGIQVQAFGMSPTIVLQNQPAEQNSQSNICSSTWIYKKDEGGLVIKNGGLFDFSISSTATNLDLDLYLYQDNGDGIWNCSQDALKTYSINDAANERIKIYFPEDGRYWLLVHGNMVPDKPATFDAQIRLISGTDLNLENIPIGPIKAGQPVGFTVKYHGKYPYTTPQELDGFLLIGTSAVPNLIEVPVRVQPTILLYPAPAFSAESQWITQTPVTFRLAVQNLGSDVETIQSVIQLPDDLVYEPGSGIGPGEILLQPSGNQLSWNFTAAGEKTTVLTFQAAARQGALPRKVEVLAQVNGTTSGQTWAVKTAVWINQFGLLFPLIMR